jgi:hypothetical protein
VTDPHTPATSPGTTGGGTTPDRVLADLRRPAGQRFENVQDVARALGIGTEQQRF